MIVANYYMMYQDDKKVLAVYGGKDHGIIFLEEVLERPNQYKNVSVKGEFVDIPGTRGELDFIPYEINEIGDLLPYGN